MQYAKIAAILSAVAGPALAAPTVARDVKNMMATDATWTIQDFLRTCNSDDTTCSYSFAVNTNDGSAATSCAYDVNGAPASTAAYNSVACGDFSIGSTHDPSGFQVLSVVRDGLIVYPGYTDAQLSTGQVVKPDQSYTPQTTP